MQPGDIYKNKHSDELITLEIVMPIAGVCLFRNSENQQITVSSFDLHNNWEKQ